MTTIGFIGSGNIGGTLARLAVDAGHDVVLSNSRGPESLHDLVTRLGPRARAATPTEAATLGDIVVVTIPIRAYRQVPAEPLRGKVVIDTLNYDPARQGRVAEIDDGDTPAHLLLQTHLTGAHVVKAFSTVFFKHLATLGRPSGAPDRSALPIAGDDPTAKKTVATLLDSLGYDAHDVGPLTESRRFAPGTPAQQAHLDPDGMFTAPGRPASATRLAALLAAAGDTTAGPTRVRGATDEELRLVETLYRAIGGEPDLLDDVLAPDWEDIPAIPGQPLGPEGMKPHIAEFHRAFADARVVIHDIVASSGLVAVRGALTGTLREEFLGVAPNGRHDEITIHEFHEIENGRVRRSWHLEDLHGWTTRMNA
ncbi:MAG: ester cyclase [Umezawaea sp.]